MIGVRVPDLIPVYADAGIYTEEELSRYLQEVGALIQASESKQSKLILINGFDEALSLRYRESDQKWLLLQVIHKVHSRQLISQNVIAAYVMKKFREKNIIALEARLYTEIDNPELQKLVTASKPLDEMRKITGKKLQRISDRGISQAYMIIKHMHIEPLTQLCQMNRMSQLDPRTGMPYGFLAAITNPEKMIPLLIQTKDYDIEDIRFLGYTPIGYAMHEKNWKLTLAILTQMKNLNIHIEHSDLVELRKYKDKIAAQITNNSVDIDTMISQAGIIGGWLDSFISVVYEAPQLKDVYTNELYVALTLLMKDLGYQSQQKDPEHAINAGPGVLYMWTQAVLVGEEEKFLKRIQLITEKRGLVDLLKKYNASENMTPRDKGIAQDVLAFLDGVAIYGGKYDFTAFRPRSLKVEKMSSNPGKLKKPNSKNSIAGVYSLHALNKFINTDLLGMIMSKKKIPIAMNLISMDSNKDIVISYDKAKESWFLCSADEPPKRVSKLDIARRVLAALGGINNIALWAKLVSTYPQVDKMVDKYLEIRPLKSENINLVSDRGMSYAFAAALHNPAEIFPQLIDMNIKISDVDFLGESLLGYWLKSDGVKWAKEMIVQMKNFSVPISSKDANEAKKYFSDDFLNSKRQAPSPKLFAGDPFSLDNSPKNPQPKFVKTALDPIYEAKEPDEPEFPIPGKKKP